MKFQRSSLPRSVKASSYVLFTKCDRLLSQFVRMVQIFSQVGPVVGAKLVLNRDKNDKSHNKGVHGYGAFRVLDFICNSPCSFSNVLFILCYRLR